LVVVWGNGSLPVVNLLVAEKKVRKSIMKTQMLLVLLCVSIGVVSLCGCSSSASAYEEGYEAGYRAAVYHMEYPYEELINGFYAYAEEHNIINAFDRIISDYGFLKQMKDNITSGSMYDSIYYDNPYGDNYDNDREADPLFGN